MDLFQCAFADDATIARVYTLFVLAVAFKPPVVLYKRVTWSDKRDNREMSTKC